MPLKLSTEQVALLRKTWRSDFESMYEVGTQVYKEIFKLAPDCARLFPFLRACPKEDWDGCRALRSLSLKFAQILSQVLVHVNAEDEAQMVALLGDVSRRHRKLATRGFRPEYWELFELVIQKVMSQQVEKCGELKPEQKASAVEAWCILARYIIATMKSAF